MSRLFALRVAAVALVTLMTPALSNATTFTYDKLAYLTFNAPVQIPGVVLHAGTYGFRLANPGTSRNVVQVVSNDGTIVYATFHTRPDSRTVVTSNPLVTFRETPAGVPAAVRSLFYGGEHRGYEFVYPRGGPIMTAEVRPQPPITYTPIPVPEKPEIEVFVEPMEYLATEAPAEAPLPIEEPPTEELPRTASPVPLVVFGGLASLLVGLGLGVLRRRYN